MTRKKHNDMEVPVSLKMVQDFKKKYPDVSYTHTADMIAARIVGV